MRILGDVVPGCTGSRLINVSDGSFSKSCSINSDFSTLSLRSDAGPCPSKSPEDSRFNLWGKKPEGDR